jgi:hypothetical protein
LEELGKVEIKSIDTQQEVAKDTGVSHDTISKVKKILETAKPEELDKVKTGKVSINQTFQNIKRRENEAEREQVVRDNLEKIQNTKKLD